MRTPNKIEAMLIEFHEKDRSISEIIFFYIHFTINIALSQMAIESNQQDFKKGGVVSNSVNQADNIIYPECHKVDIDFLDSLKDTDGKTTLTLDGESLEEFKNNLYEVKKREIIGANDE